eukprot:COSAG01_NODE_54770_length_329_cov_24.656522_1_plen_24_part_01
MPPGAAALDDYYRTAAPWSSTWVQ